MHDAPEEDQHDEENPGAAEIEESERATRGDAEGGESEGADESSDQPPSGDEWTHEPVDGLLYRWHRHPRTELFGHAPEDWSESPVGPAMLSHRRRTVIWRDDRRIGQVEDSRHNTERPSVCDEPWVGYTAFRTLERAREDDEAGLGLPMEADPDPSIEDVEELEEEDGSALTSEESGAGEGSTRTGESSTQTPPSEASTLRSRTPARDEDRRVGYIAHSPELERMSRIEDERSQGLEDAARSYIEWCVGGTKFSPEAIKEAAYRGDRLLEQAGDLPRAMEALRVARKEVIGEPLRGVLSEETRACISDDHYTYLEEMVEEGIPSRREYASKRVRADPYPSALDHLDELYEKSWKDAKWGIVLYCTDGSEDQTKDLVECPQGRVPKQLPDRSISSEGRPIHAMLVANAATHKHHHPPALQPRHRQIARKALWWAYRHPGISCTLAKLDVSRAFKWHDIRPEDAGDFGSALPGGPVGVEGRVKLVYGGMPFGWTGAPGEYMIFALAGRAIHESYRPSQAHMNGPNAFSSEWLMDDSVTLEPKLGTRPYQAVDCLGHAITSVWGEDALNLEKQLEEGTPSTKQIVWGMIMDMQEMTCRLPEPKALKMRYLLALEELRYGCREVRLRTARELRGLAQYASIAIPPLRTELSVLDVMLSTSQADGGYVRPNVEGAG